MRALGVRPLTRPDASGPVAEHAAPAGTTVDEAEEPRAVPAPPWIAAPLPLAPPGRLQHAMLGTTLPGAWQETPHGRCFVVEHRYDLDHRHGAVPLTRLLDLPEETLSHLGRNPAFRGVDRRRLLFFDTETTGLSGGTGTYVFLVGLGYFEDNTFVVQQIFLPDLESERALLHVFNNLLGRSTCLVSFNGRAFDWPLLESRFTLSRMRPVQGDPLHLDLLAPARRVWKDWLPSCALGSLEGSVLRFRRQGDVPGWLIPTLYFQYLRGEPVSALLPVFEHNRLDVLSLLALAGHLGGLLQAPEGADLQSAECYGLGRFYEDLGNYEASVRSYERALKGVLSPTLRAATLQRLTGAHRKLSQHEEALRIWEELVARDTTLVFPYVELAKHYEHHARDYGQAVALVDRALALCADPWARATLPRGLQADLQRRRARLEQKAARAGAGLRPPGKE